MRVQLTFESGLKAPPEEVWRWATSMAGITAELMPFLKMTAPPGVTAITDVAIAPGTPLFKSRVLLLGFIPVDRMDLTLIEYDEGRGFVEQSPMHSMKLWRHERRIAASPAGSILTDTITFEPRFAKWLTAWFFRKLFEHRHRVLARQFG